MLLRKPELRGAPPLGGDVDFEVITAHLQRAQEWPREELLCSRFRL